MLSPRLRWHPNLFFPPQQVLATASAVSRANMATSDWLRPFDFDRVFWSMPDQATKEDEKGTLASEQATQQKIFEGLGERIVDDVLNVSMATAEVFFREGGLMEAALAIFAPLVFVHKEGKYCHLARIRAPSRPFSTALVPSRVCRAVAGLQLFMLCIRSHREWQNV